MKQIPKGRPNSQKPPTQHQQRKKKPQQIKQHWTQHRITLIAYQSQYMNRKKPQDTEISGKKEKENDKKSKGKGKVCIDERSQEKKKNGRKKVNLEYQSGFLTIGAEQSEEIKVAQLIKGYQQLNKLFHPAPQHPEPPKQLQQLLKIMLQLKHSCIVHQFCELYNIIIHEIQKLQFNQIYKQQHRFTILQTIKNKLITYIENNKQKFMHFCKFLIEDQKQTKKLLLVEAYCFMAEKFCFNINQFYSQAFNVCYQGVPSKRVKKG